MSDYESDIALWSEQQGALLRRRSMGELVNERELDWSNIAEEIESLSRSQRSALRSHIAVVLEHLIKLTVSPAIEPRNQWMMSVIDARSEIELNLEDSPSLRRFVAEMIQQQTPRSGGKVARALILYAEQPRVDIDSLTFTEDQVLGEWWPPAP